MDLQLSGKRAVVTGGSKGIGLAVARALVDEGAHVVLAARSADALEAARATLVGRARDGQQVLAVPTDTTDDAAVRLLVDTTVAELGGVDVLVNAAAEPAPFGSPTALASLEDDELRRQMETKVLGYLRTARAAAPHMTAQGWGRIINVSGLAARQAGSAFGAIRNVAVAALTKTLADELGRSGVNVTVVHPGMTVTERTPAMVEQVARARGITEPEALAVLAQPVSIGRLVTAEEVADVVAFLASPRSVAVNGDAVAVGGGARGPIHY
ncbi:SDR family NAD(P)-dependent oxidoreductase [Microlunatus antarcticus]|uniref:NAD(P)-dependent dehydrogenase (Short-subunit alcohol dehydrogenase family) n=1 Tax=Microlunatus antarcticus TaxID=53388 RepID=A0A7W5P8L5_9ACTN|nr:SDR family NAD(P)-dependent oxidoreductase [Microlunatus antarcticus]MBB3328026.1 NAD(P)-dependent dehydrogenase (short-subunit alcohol dehydrogenase family) [Microlunatus antarcticus]